MIFYISHWDERYFYNEVVSAYLGEHAVDFSPLTLVLLEDSGWYEANYSMAEVSISTLVILPTSTKINVI